MDSFGEKNCIFLQDNAPAHKLIKAMAKISELPSDQIWPGLVQLNLARKPKR